MAKRRHAPKTENFLDAQDNYPHLSKYVEKIVEKYGDPEWHLKLDKGMRKKKVNLIYPIGDPLFVHILRQPGMHITYTVVEPALDDRMRTLYELVTNKMVEYAHRYPVPDKVEDAEPVILKIMNDVVEIKEGAKVVIPKSKALGSKKLVLDPYTYDSLKYFIIRNRVGYAKLEPLFYDPYLEDLHCTGVGAMKVIHKIFDMVYTNIDFKDDFELDKYVIESSERVERPVSDAHSVVDAIMPDGSRVNYIYSRELSLEGSSFTIRKFSEVPVSITQIINWGTMSARVAAYMWLALENGMNTFVCGETASGKTTSLNAMCCFIKPDDKVYTVENVPEVTIPHATWQHLVTRESGKDSDVTIFDLLIAALRSRPNYIIVGEIRGEEGNVAFQAMQTGHPVMSTFHAGSPHSMIQRITSHPIDVPIASIDNLNIVLIQQAVSRGGHMVRRVLSITEIERYYDVANKVITREVFNWDPVSDKHIFRGLFNSYILEKKIATILGFEDTRDIYKELDLRTKILQRMVEHKIFDYFDVWDVMKKYHEDGLTALPFNV